MSTANMALDKVALVNKINGFLAEEFEVDENLMAPDANLKETLELDSLDFVDLVVIIESNFGFKVNADDLTSIKTFQDMYDYIEARVNKA